MTRQTSGPLLICAATSIEARGCRTGIERARAWDRFEVLQTGMGMKAAEAALRKRLASGSPVRAVVSSGVAGSKRRDVRLGDWVLASEVAADGRETLPVSGVLEEVLARTALAWKSGRCLTREAVSGAREALPTDIVDMESWALAQVAREAGIPFDVLRLVSDTPEQPIPEAVGTLAGIGAAAGTSERVKRLWSGSLQALGAPRELAGFARRSLRIPALLAEGWETLARARLPG